MGADSRLNLLLSPLPEKDCGDKQPWHRTLTHLLEPLGVRTFEAKSGPHAMELIEKHPIHLAVVDTRLPTISGMNVLQLIQRLRDQPAPAPHETSAGGASFRFHMEVKEAGAEGETPERRIEVRFEGPARMVGPTVILIAPPPPQQDRQLLQEALKFNAFSVLSEPVDVNLALEVMARAMKRFHQNQWPS